MARRWVVLTADRAPHVEHEIITYTEWVGLLPAADEVIYTNPVDADGNAVDTRWKVSGSVTRTGAGTAGNPYVYTYADNSLEPSLAERQRGQIHDAYLYWRIFGRTNHWAGIRRTHKPETIFDALDGTDKWALHIVALIDQAIRGAFPAGGYTAEQLQALIDHADNILRNLGPTWYLAQFDTMNDPKPDSDSYRDLAVAAGTVIYTDICTAAGVIRGIDGTHLPMPTVIHASFKPEDRNQGA